MLGAQGQELNRGTRPEDNDDKAETPRSTMT